MTDNIRCQESLSQRCQWHESLKNGLLTDRKMQDFMLSIRCEDCYFDGSSFFAT